MANEFNAFDDAFNSASHGSNINKTIEVPKVEVETTDQHVNSAGSDCDTSVGEPQTSSENEPSEQPVRKRGRKKKDADNGVTGSDVGHFSCICDAKLIAQVRAIAWQEHMTVRAVVESMFTKCIAKYEKKHGPIQAEQNRPSDELF